MTTFRFRGLLSGSTVALSVAQSATSRSTTTTWGELRPNASFEIAIHRRMPHLVAPFAFWARPANITGFAVSEPSGDTNIYDPTQHDVTWIWQLSGAAYTPKVTPNIPTVWRDIFTAYGKMPSFVIPSAGDWTLTCFAFDRNGRWGEATYIFEAGGDGEAIVSADSFFATTKTICVSQASDFTGKPTGATEVTSIAAAITAAATLMGSGTVARILLRAGETFDGAALSMDGASFRNILTAAHVGKFGAGADPILNAAPDGAIFAPTRGTQAQQYVVYDLDCRGPWDSTTETGRIASLGFWLTSNSFALVFRCKVNGLNTDEYRGTTTTANSSNMICDTEITNWQNFGAAAFGGNYISYIGCDIHQHEDALSGIHQLPSGGGTNSNPWELGNRHGPVRLDPGTGGVMDTTHFRCNSFFSRNGWSLNSPIDAVSLPPTAAQPCLRFGPIATTRHHHSLDRNSFEGGSDVIVLTQTNVNNSTTLARNVVFDKILIAGTHHTYNTLFTNWNPGVTMRNTHLWRPNVTRSSSNVPAADINVPFGGTYIADLGPVRLYNNTIYSDALSSYYSGSFAPIVIDSDHDDAVDENNVIYIPSEDLGDGTGDEPTYVFEVETIAGFVPREKGARWNFPAIGGPVLGSAIRVTSVREGGAGTVMNDEWVLIDYPNFTGLNNGAGMADVRAAILANTTQKHIVSVTTVSTKRMGDTGIWADADGLVAFDFTNAGYMRVQNLSGVPWTSGDIQVLLDLSDFLMDFVPGTASPPAIPLPVPASGSDTLAARDFGLWARDDFFGTLRGVASARGAFHPTD